MGGHSEYNWFLLVTKIVCGASALVITFVLYAIGRPAMAMFLLTVSVSICVGTCTDTLYWLTVPPGHGAILTRYRRTARLVTADSTLAEGVKMPLIDTAVVFNWIKESLDASDEDSSIVSPEVSIFLGVRSVRVKNAEVVFDDGHPALADVYVRYRIRDAAGVCASSHAPGVAFKHFITALASNSFADTKCDLYFKNQTFESSALNARFKAGLKKVVTDGLEILYTSIKAHPPERMAPVVDWNNCVKQIFHYEDTLQSLMARDIAYKNKLLAEKVLALQKTQREIECFGVEKKEALSMAVQLVSKTLTPYNGWMQQCSV